MTLGFQNSTCVMSYINDKIVSQEVVMKKLILFCLLIIAVLLS